MRSHLNSVTSAAPLAVFRVALGLLLLAGVIRFWYRGWIEALYIQPRFYFSFYGFEFVKPLGEYTYILFAVCAIAALMVALGFYYRVASVVLFLSFTYIELIDKSTYLNHYYFISMMCLLMMFVPAQARFSIDAWRNPAWQVKDIPSWTLDAIKLLVCFLYFFAGLAKLNSDWLLHAQPLRIWLPAKNDIPVIGELFNYPITAFVFSWFGCLYDLFIPFLLWNRRTVYWAYGAVVLFHGFTALLFPIGMFPYVMIATALIFFPPSFHEKIIHHWNRIFSSRNRSEAVQGAFQYAPVTAWLLIIFFGLFFTVQALLPFRYLAYPGELFWTEQGYRFSWRVMLMEKAGYAEFTVRDTLGHVAVADNRMFLTTLQEKMMATQPDMMLQYAHFLRDYYAQQGFVEPEVYVDSYVTLNGRLGRPLVDAKTNLARERESWKHKDWILPFPDAIQGF